MQLISDCIIPEKGNVIYREEEGKEISFTNEEFELVCDVVPIEKCVLNKAEDGRRCDFLFLFDRDKQEYRVLKNKNSLAYYVELKGIGLEDACEQLYNSIEKTREQISRFEIIPLVVSSREYVPKYDNNEWNRNLKRLLRKEIQFEITPHKVKL
jgi:hypothetical protein